ncbi:MAG: TraB/GumN family protein [Oligoflexia bacterium]|nr:TraB/GumN family protein [Oligoflexia bacterium]
MRVLLVFYFVSFGTVACSPNLKGPFFWKAEKNGKTIHILGTIHVGVGLEDLQCHQVISDSLGQSALLWTETDIKRQQELLQTAVSALVMNPSGHSFKSLNEESQNFFKTKAGQDNSITQLSYFGFLGYLNSICLIEHKKFLKERLGSFQNNQTSLDVQIQQLAQTKNIAQDYLDEEDYIPELIRSNVGKISKEQVEKAVREYSRNCQQEKIAKALEDQFETMEDIMQKYKNGDSFDLLEIDEQNFKQQGWTEEMLKDYRDNVRHNLLRKRNEVWLKKLLSTHVEGNANMFVAGGLAHFQGSYNVLNKLKENGFSVKRFNSDCKAE